MRIYYQNNVSGAAHDITSLITKASWFTERRDSPGKLELTAMTYPEIVWTHGGIVTVLDDTNKGIFYGYVFKITQNENDETEIVAYDQLRYLKNKETYVFTNKRADEIVKKIASDFKLNLGGAENTKYVIPSLVMDNETLYDTILKALDITLINTGEMYYLWDDFGSLKLSNIKSWIANIVIGDNSYATGYTYTSSIDNRTFNKIKLGRNNSETGKREIYIWQDSKNMTLWGVLQDYEVVDENMTPAQVKQHGETKIALYNRPTKTFDITAISDLRIRAGRSIYVHIEQLKQSQYYIVESAEHDLLDETMRLSLKAV